MPRAKEHWRDVVGYEGYYEVSDKGRVRNSDGLIMKPWRNKGAHGWYMRIELCKEGHSWRPYVHALVLEAFEGPRPLKPVRHEGRHLDGDTFNNFYKNLLWGTPKENAADRHYEPQPEPDEVEAGGGKQPERIC